MSHVHSQKIRRALAELALGGTWKIGGSSLFYADITRSFGGDYEMQWKLNAGIRYAF